jgi:hypothetical protein
MQCCLRLQSLVPKIAHVLLVIFFLSSMLHRQNLPDEQMRYVQVLSTLLPLTCFFRLFNSPVDSVSPWRSKNRELLTVLKSSFLSDIMRSSTKYRLSMNYAALNSSRWEPSSPPLWKSKTATILCLSNTTSNPERVKGVYKENFLIRRIRHLVPRCSADSGNE